ncbi:MAG TPA: hypothetical protein VHC47_11510, partial [Mucilaginibacter sp.]|nr:hypothetical protein [Mucilaginibacter sp.]
MKRLLFWTLLTILPVLLKAQAGQILQKDFEKKVDFLTATFRVNDHLSIAEIAVDPENFELVAIDDKMQALWRVPFKGSPAGSGNFKGHILTIGADRAGKSKDAAVIYTAYMLDEHTGKIILQKTIYTDNAPMEADCKSAFAKDGSWLKIIIRGTGAKRGARFTAMDKYNETHDLTILDIDDQLSATVSKPQLFDGLFAGFASTGADGYFIFYLQPDGSLKASKYLVGQTAPAVSITQDLDMLDKSGSEQVSYNSTPSETEKDVAYFSILHRNLQKQYELSVCRLDFSQGKGKMVNEELSNDHLKSIEKAFVRPDKELDDAYVGKGDFLVVKHMADYGGTLIVTYGADFFRDNYRIQNSSVINAYDKDLNLKFQQVMPSVTVYAPTGNASASFHNEGDKMYMVANYGNMKYYTIYGQL